VRGEAEKDRSPKGQNRDVIKYKWLLFDADGTLFDYDRAEATALKKTFEEVGPGFEPAYATAYRRINGEIWLEFERGRISQEKLRARRFELLFEAMGIECDAGAFSGRYLRNLAAASQLIEGAEEIVKKLHGKAGLMIMTNGLKDVQRPRFARSIIGGYFDDVVISEEVGVAKPDRRIFDVAFQKMDHPRKEDVLIVGDSLTSDIKGGSDYGIDTCWFNPKQKPRSLDIEIRYEIDDLKDLWDVVQAGGDGPARSK
jgi:2-haloacid dehalogenase